MVRCSLGIAHALYLCLTRAPEVSSRGQWLRALIRSTEARKGGHGRQRATTADGDSLGLASGTHVLRTLTGRA